MLQTGVAVLAALLLALPAAAAERAAPRRLLAATFPVFQIVRQVVRDVPGIQLELLFPAEAGCPHDRALTPRDMRKLAEADILAINGLGLEAFADQDLARLNPRLAVADAAEGAQDLLPDGETGRFNPHLFASPRRAAGMSLTLGNRLAQLDPDHADLYRKNAAAYAQRLNRLADAFAELGGRLANRRIVTGHNVFDYLARDMGLEVSAVLQAGENRQPAAADLLRLIRLIREQQVGAVFSEPGHAETLARTVAREAGIPAARLDPVAGGPADAPPDYYETVMRANLHTLERTLGTR